MRRPKQSRVLPATFTRPEWRRMQSELRTKPLFILIARFKPIHTMLLHGRNAATCTLCTQFDCALQTYVRPIGIAAPDKQTLLSAGRCVFQHLEPATATLALRELLPANVDTLNAERAMAFALADRGDYQEAIPILLKVLRQRHKHREDTPWYPSMRLLRQSKPGVWSDIIATVRRALQSEKTGP